MTSSRHSVSDLHAHCVVVWPALGVFARSRVVVMDSANLLEGPSPTYLPEEPEVVAALAASDPADVVRAHPESSLAWAELADEAWTAGDDLQSYAFARVGYHRGLDALRRNGWRGHGPVPADHPGNMGFLRCLAALSRAADSIGEEAEADRCATFLADCGGLG